ncbi:MAG: replication initiation protein [Candidatus Competibacteraceae bacterium]|nr:replication initiation protein [Candidatus Competibacteraceae bacterium]
MEEPQRNQNFTPHQLSLAIDGELKKHPSAIHVTSLPMAQRKLHNTLMFCAARSGPRPSATSQYKVSISRLAQLADINTRNIRYLKDSLRAITQTTVEWNLMDDESDDWGVMAMLSEANVRNGFVYFSFPARLERVLRRPSIFATIRLDIQRRFKSRFSLALYENALRYVNVGRTRWMNPRLMAKLIGASDSSKESRETKYLTDRVRRSIEEINDKSDILVELELRRQGRLIREMRLLVWHKPLEADVVEPEDMLADGEVMVEETAEASDTSPPSLEEELIEDLGLARQVVEEILRLYEEPLVRQVLPEVRNRLLTGRVRYVEAYLKAVLKDARSESRQRSPQASEVEQRLDDQEEQERALSRRFAERRIQLIARVLEKLSTEEQEAIQREFEAWVVRQPRLGKRFKEQGFESQWVCTSQEDFLARRLADYEPALNETLEVFRERSRTGRRSKASSQGRG